MTLVDHLIRPRERRRAALAAALVIVALVMLPGVPATAASEASLQPILSGYRTPVLVTSAPGRSRVIFIVEQEGVIKRATFRGGAWRKLGAFLDIRHLVLGPSEGHFEQGLLSLAFHPRYQRNGRLYVYYVRDAPGGGRDDTVVAEFRRTSRGRSDASTHRTVTVLQQPAFNHNGGHLAFGPDGLLYLSTGDGAFPADPHENAQDPSSRLGKLLRFDPIKPKGSARRLRIPPSNPFVGKAGHDDMVWALGLRNPWRYSFDRMTGDLWVGDVGERSREEVNRARSNRWGQGAGRGRNFGWDDCEGTFEFEDDEGDADAACGRHTLPTYDYAHDRPNGACSVTGGHVHRGPGARAWRGLYLAGDFCGRLFVLNGKGALRFSTNTGLPLTSFGEDAAGRIFATDQEGRVSRVRFRGPRP